MKIRIAIPLILLIILGCENSNNFNEEGFLAVKGNKIHFKSKGQGEPVLFIHGGYLNLNMWETQVNQFAENGYQVIRYSDLGHGETETVNNNCYGYEIIDALVQHFSISKINIIGLSWGAMLGIDYCLKYPDKVNKIVLASPGLNGWEYFQDSLSERNYLERKIAMDNNNKIKAANLFHQNWVVGPRRVESALSSNFSTRAKLMIEKTMKDHWKEDWSKLDSIKAITQLGKIRNKTLIIRGDQDATDILSITERYNRELVNSELITFENVAHAVNMERSKLFNDVVLKFLKE